MFDSMIKARFKNSLKFYLEVSVDGHIPKSAYPLHTQLTHSASFDYDVEWVVVCFLLVDRVSGAGKEFRRFCDWWHH